MICLKIRTFVVSATTSSKSRLFCLLLWFAWKFVPLWYQQQPNITKHRIYFCCDLLENSYLCGISNNPLNGSFNAAVLWFAWKFVPLWYQQQLLRIRFLFCFSCDLLENSYLCGISNNKRNWNNSLLLVVICLKIRTFVVSATTSFAPMSVISSCDLLENSYLCGISNNI